MKAFNTSLLLKVYGSLKKYLGIIAILIIAGSYLFYMFNVRFWKLGMGTISWDTISYYAYLPAKFIYDDISLKFIDEDNEFFTNYVWPEVTEDKKYVIKTSMGLAYLYSPFFFAGHIYAQNSDYPANGYSPPYHASLAFSGLFYSLLGFIFLWKILRRYFIPEICFLVMLSIGLATNLFTYSTQHGTMPHSFNFALITAFTWLTISWHQKKSWLKSLLIGFLVGMIILIRPTNIVVVFIFILFGVTSIKGLKDKIENLFQDWGHLLLIICAALLVWIPQILYWKMQTGHFLYFSYGSDERFFWLEPVFFKGLFSFRKGWLIYTPLMIFSLAGLFFMKGKVKEFRLAFPVVMILAMYLTFSWWCWWYGGGFGMRPMIDFYGLFAVSLGAFMTWVLTLKIKPVLFFAGAFSLSVLFGAYHHLQYHYGALHYDSMTWEAYKYSFGKRSAGKDLGKFIQAPDYERAKRERVKSN